MHLCLLLTHRFGQNHTFIGIYSVYTVFLAGESPYIRSYTVCIYGSGQPYLLTYCLCIFCSQASLASAPIGRPSQTLTCPPAPSSRCAAVVTQSIFKVCVCHTTKCVCVSYNKVCVYHTTKCVCIIQQSVCVSYNKVCVCIIQQSVCVIQ